MNIAYCYTASGEYVVLDQDGSEQFCSDELVDIAQFYTEQSGGLEPTYCGLPANLNPLDLFKPLDSEDISELNDLISAIKNEENGFSMRELTFGEFD
jgi:hypothetical protein